MPTFRLPDAPAYLVAFSGGADSRLLLELTVRALLERDGEAGRHRVTAVHLHHGIRGKEADRDEGFCRSVCARLGVELICERADVPALAEATGESLETAARRARYRLFRQVMLDKHIPILLTAHHADDNLETVLERLLRGSGTRGMGGIPACRALDVASAEDTFTIHRPLLAWTRRDILAACQERGLDFVTDSTNLETDCTRNRIRHAVIPELEVIAGADAPQRAAARLSASACEDEDCLTGLAEAQVGLCLSPEGDGLLLEELQRQHPAIAKRMMMLLYEGLTAEANPHDGSGTLSAAHLEALCGLIRKAIPESAVTLPRGMEARIRGEWFYIRPTQASPPPPEPILLTEGSTQWGEAILLVEASPAPLPPLEGDTVWASAVFPPGLSLPLLARGREAGDEILSHGMTKKLKKLLCDAHVPRYLRDRIPLICLSDGSPLWYPGVVFRDGFPAPTQGACLRITVTVKP